MNKMVWNQEMIERAIKDGNMRFLPCRKQGTWSIGQIIKFNYQLEQEKNQQKVNKNNSILYTREWISKYLEEGLEIPNRKLFTSDSMGDILSILYENRTKIKKINRK